MAEPTQFEKDLSALLNRHRMERLGGNTPDFILAQYLTECIFVFKRAVQLRDVHYGVPVSEVVTTRE